MEGSEINERSYLPGRFPNPVVQTAYMLTVDVEDDNGNLEVKNILSSSSGMYYKFVITIKKSIYGLVVKGLVLRPTDHGTFKRTSEEVAIKVCSKDVLQRIGASSLENPVMEVGAMQDFGQPRHPNLSTQYECCVDERNIYSILQFHKGSELFDHILFFGPLTESVARVVFQQLILALFRLQQRNIAHRDVSLENIMYTAESHAAVLIDFGLAVKLQTDPATGQVVPIRNVACGKAYYLPPEVDWSGSHPEPINPLLSDVWSAGMSLLYALLGFPPIERACNDDMRYHYLTTGRLSELLEHWEVSLSRECADLVQFILRPEPLDRPSLAQIWQHPWMQQAGLNMPYASMLSADEIGRLCAPTATTPNTSGSTDNNSNNNRGGIVLAPLQTPSEMTDSGDSSEHQHHHRQHMGMQSGRAVDDGAMCISDDDQAVGEGEDRQSADYSTREFEGESIRSSIDSHWSATTTPTGRTSMSSAGHNYLVAAQACGALPPPHVSNSSSGQGSGQGSGGSSGGGSGGGNNAGSSSGSSGTTTSASSTSGGSPYYTRSRAASPHIVLAPSDMPPPLPSPAAADHRTRSGSTSGSAGVADAAQRQGAGGGAKNSNNGTASPGNPNGGGFRAMQTRSMSFGKANVNYTS